MAFTWLKNLLFAPETDEGSDSAESDVDAGYDAANEGCDADDTLLFVKRSVKAVAPTRGSKYAAGYDLCAIESVLIHPGGLAKINTGLSIKTPIGTYGRIASRSSLAAKMITSAGGVIDRDYTGEIIVILYNLSGEFYRVNEGDRVAQLILEQIVTLDPIEVKLLPETDRGDGGFGSTGV